MQIDFYLGVDEYVSSGEAGSPFGGTGSPNCEDGQYVFGVGDLSIKGALAVYINSGVNLDSIDIETGQFSLNHEAGHFIFAVEQASAYDNDKLLIEASGEAYSGGHHKNARTGQIADKYGKKKDI